MAVTSQVDPIQLKRAEQARRLDRAQLLAMVELDPNDPVVDQGRLAESGVAVWSIVNYVEQIIGSEIGGTLDAPTIARIADD
jgi:hypothetical protein